MAFSMQGIKGIEPHVFHPPAFLAVAGSQELVLRGSMTLHHFAALEKFFESALDPQLREEWQTKIPVLVDCHVQKHAEFLDPHHIKCGHMLYLSAPAVKSAAKPAAETTETSDDGKRKKRKRKKSSKSKNKRRRRQSPEETSTDESDDQ